MFENIERSALENPPESVFTRDLKDPLRRLQTVHRLYGKLIADIDRRLPRMSITVTERRILLELGYHPGMTDAQLARSLGLDRSHLSRSVQKLIGDGRISHTQSPRHASQRLLRLTADGVTTAQTIERHWANALSEQLHELDSDELSLVTSAAAAAVVGPQDLENDLALEFRALDPRAFAYMLQRAEDEGRKNLVYTSAGITRFLEADLPTLGTAAYHFGRIVGVCMLVPLKEEVSICEVVAFHYQPMHRVTAAGPMLAACIENAKELTMARVTADVLDQNKTQAQIYKALRFEKRPDAFYHKRFGGVELVRRFQLTFPLFGASAETAGEVSSPQPGKSMSKS